MIWASRRLARWNGSGQIELFLSTYRRRAADFLIVGRASSPVIGVWTFSYDRGAVSGVWTFFAAELANIKPGVEAWIAAQRLNRLARVL